MQSNRRFHKHVPNIITCMNLFAGMMAIVYVVRFNYTLALFFVLIASIMDLLDGLAARILKASSEFGKILDSIADVVSFGVVPTFVMYRVNALFIHTQVQQGVSYPLVFKLIVLYFPFMILIFSALRLAKFHTSSRSDYFSGLPTPANALLIVSFWYFLMKGGQVFSDSFFEPVRNGIMTPWFLMGFIAFSCLMMIADIPMFSLKFKTFRFRDQWLQYLFLLLSVILLIVFKLFAMPFILLLYIALSLFFFRPGRKVESLEDGSKN